MRLRNQAWNYSPLIFDSPWHSGVVASFPVAQATHTRGSMQHAAHSTWLCGVNSLHTSLAIAHPKSAIEGLVREVLLSSTVIDITAYRIQSIK